MNKGGPYWTSFYFFIYDVVWGKVYCDDLGGWIRRIRGELPVQYPQHVTDHVAVCVFDMNGTDGPNPDRWWYPYVAEVLHNSFIATTSNYAGHIFYKTLFIKKSLELYTKYVSASSSGLNANSLFLYRSDTKYADIFAIIDGGIQFYRHNRAQFNEKSHFIFNIKRFETELFNISSEFLERHDGVYYYDDVDGANIKGWQIAFMGTNYVK